MRFRARQPAANVDYPHADDACEVMRQARVLLQAPALQALMAGRKLALLSPGEADAQACGHTAGQTDPSAHEFVQAATALGAHVSFVQAGLDERASPRQVETTARVLGRLYDAVECQHLPLSLVRRLARSAGIPVFAGLATPAHPTAALASELADDAPLPTRRRRILQAALLVSLG